MWRLVLLFDCFWLFLTIGTLLVHCWYSLSRPVTIGTPMVIFAVLTVFRLSLTVFDCFWRLIHCWYSLGRPVSCDDWYTNSFECFWRLVQCTIRQKQSKGQKTVKTAKMTIGVPIVTCLHRVRLIHKVRVRVCVRVRIRRIHKAAQTPLPCETSIKRASAVITARHPWAGLTVCVYNTWTSIRVAPVRCSSSSLSTTVIKCSIFSDPTRKLSALPPELRS